MRCKLTVFCMLGAAICLQGQYAHEQQLSVGSILVAKEQLADPNFARSVILIVQYDRAEGTVGLVINRATRIPLSRVFPNIKNATSDPAFVGGPVEVTAVQALLRLSQKTDDATAVGDDVYVSGAKELIEKSIAARAEPSQLRIYLGYAGWAPRQLEAEVGLGAWLVLHRRSNIVFDKDPDTLWSRLIRESEMRIAALPAEALTGLSRLR